MKSRLHAPLGLGVVALVCSSFLSACGARLPRQVEGAQELADGSNEDDSDSEDLLNAGQELNAAFPEYNPASPVPVRSGASATSPGSLGGGWNDNGVPRTLRFTASAATGRTLGITEWELHFPWTEKSTGHLVLQVEGKARNATVARWTSEIHAARTHEDTNSSNDDGAETHVIQQIQFGGAEDRLNVATGNGDLEQTIVNPDADELEERFRPVLVFLRHDLKLPSQAGDSSNIQWMAVGRGAGFAKQDSATLPGAPTLRFQGEDAALAPLTSYVMKTVLLTAAVGISCVATAGTGCGAAVAALTAGNAVFGLMMQSMSAPSMPDKKMPTFIPPSTDEFCEPTGGGRGRRLQQANWVGLCDRAYRDLYEFVAYARRAVGDSGGRLLPDTYVYGQNSDTPGLSGLQHIQTLHHNPSQTGKSQFPSFLSMEDIHFMATAIAYGFLPNRFGQFQVFHQPVANGSRVTIIKVVFNFAIGKLAQEFQRQMTVIVEDRAGGGAGGGLILKNGFPSGQGEGG